MSRAHHVSFLAFLLTAVLAAAESNVEIEFTARLARIGVDQIEERVALASWAQGKGLVNQAIDLLNDVLKAKPGHSKARSLLGYEQIDGRWLAGEELYLAKKWVRWLGRWMPPAQQRKLVARRDALRAQLRARSGWDKAWETKTAHFTITSNAQVRVVEEISLAMEQYYTVASRMFLLRGTQARIPVEVYADQAEFQRVSAASGMAVANEVLGYYVSGKDLIRCFYAGNMESTLSVLFHETTHLIVNRFAKREVPTWTNEGLAVYFEDAQRLEDRVDPDAVPWNRLWHLRDMLGHGPINLDDTVTCAYSNYSVEYYPRGWSLVHFLLHGAKGKYSKLFVNYLLALRSGNDQSAMELFVRHIGKRPADLHSEWLAHIHGIEPRTGAEYAAAALDSIGLRLDPVEAQQYAEKGVAAAPEDWRTHAALGQVLLARARLESDQQSGAAAVAALDRAVELAKVDPVSIRARVKGPRKESLSVWTGLVEDRIFALIAAGDSDRALVAAGELLEIDEASAHAYAALAVIGSQSASGRAEAAECIVTARDLGNDHLVRWCSARLAAANGDTGEAKRLLAEAAALDCRGLGREWYRREMSRMALAR